MKILARLIILLTFGWSCIDSQAQQLSKTELQIVKDIQQGIININSKTGGGFKDLIINGVLAKHTDVILYNAQTTKLLHVGKYSLLNYFNKKRNIYARAYDNSHDVMLAEKAFKEMSLKSGSNWKVVNTKNDQKDFITNNLYHNKNWVAYFEKPKDDKTMVMSFFAQYTNEEDSTGLSNMNTSNDAFVKDFK